MPAKFKFPCPFPECTGGGNTRESLRVHGHHKHKDKLQEFLQLIHADSKPKVTPVTLTPPPTTGSAGASTAPMSSLGAPPIAPAPAPAAAKPLKLSIPPGQISAMPEAAPAAPLQLQAPPAGVQIEPGKPEAPPITAEEWRDTYEFLYYVVTVPLKHYLKIEYPRWEDLTQEKRDHIGKALFRMAQRHPELFKAWLLDLIDGAVIFAPLITPALAGLGKYIGGKK